MKRLLSLLLTWVVCVVIQGEPLPEGEYRYWFDDDYTSSVGQSIPNNSAHLEIDASSLSSSSHVLHFMVTDRAGNASVARSVYFTKPYTMGSSKAYIYVDGELFTSTEAADYGKNGYEFELDAKGLSYGLHTMLVQIMSSEGIVSTVAESVFMRVPTAQEVRQMRCHYLIDNDSTTIATGAFNGEVLHADIDVSGLSDGLHTITFMLAAENGITTKSFTEYFMKLPAGGVNIRSYEYWVNDDTGSRKKVVVDGASNPYSLAALIPMKSYPVRSSNFKFAIEGDEAVVYPCNDFNVLFTDNRGYFALQTSKFTDANGRKVIDDADMRPFTRAQEKVGVISKDDIVWYKITAQAGDSLSLKVSPSCSFSLYDPAGNELISALGAEAVKGTGCYTSSSGTHYLAFHDQTGKNGGITATLSHIDRYALTSFSPSKMAAEGYVILDLVGNGYSSLKKVELVGSGGSRVSADTIVAYRRDYARVRFNFHRTPFPEIGRADLLLTFDDDGEDAIVERKSAVALASPEVKDLKVTVKPNNQRTGTTRDFQVIVSNPSNMAMWGVPFNIARTSQSPDLQFGFACYGSHVDDPNPYDIYYDTDNLLGKGETGRFIPMMIPYIGPYEQLVYEFSIEHITGNNFKFYAWCGVPWSIETRGMDDSGEESEIKYSNTHLLAPPPPSPYAFNYHRFSDFQQAMNDVAGNRHTPKPVSTGLGITNVALSTGCAMGGIIGGLDGYRKRTEQEAYKGLYEGIEDGLVHYRIPTGMSPRSILENSGIVPDWMLDGWDLLTGNQGCSETPHPTPDPTNMVFNSSFDPNDIIGFTSDAGTEHIGLGVEHLDYIVEFENDSTFATASASMVTVSNQLDTKVFDLATFRPTLLKLGKKVVSFIGEEQEFVTTVDMRPEINGIAEARLTLDKSSGLLNLVIRSLDPYTMNESEDYMQGFLPVNEDGNGIGELHYSVALKSGLSDGVAVDNQADIVFDHNEAIKTPVWHNVTDYVYPVSEVVSVETDDDMSFKVTVTGSDSRSGIWYYNLYMRSKEKPEWSLVKEELTEEECVITSDIQLSGVEFKSLAVDCAGNIENKIIGNLMLGDVDANGKVDANDFVLLCRYYASNDVVIELSVADINGDGKIDSQDTVSLLRLYVDTNINKTQRLRKYPRLK